MSEEKNIEKNCGSPSCLVDRLEETLMRQHEETKKFLGQLITVHISALSKQFDTMEDKIKEYGDEMFPRLRKVEDEVLAFKNNDDIRWVGRFRANLNKIMVAVTIAALLGGTGYFLFIYDTHGRPAEYPGVQRSNQ
jgi:hypothetical protein